MLCIVYVLIVLLPKFGKFGLRFSTRLLCLRANGAGFQCHRVQDSDMMTSTIKHRRDRWNTNVQVKPVGFGMCLVWRFIFKTFSDMMMLFKLFFWRCFHHHQDIFCWTPGLVGVRPSRSWSQPRPSKKWPPLALSKCFWVRLWSSAMELQPSKFTEVVALPRAKTWRWPETRFGSSVHLKLSAKEKEKETKTVNQKTKTNKLQGKKRKSIKTSISKTWQLSAKPGSTVRPSRSTASHVVSSGGSPRPMALIRPPSTWSQWFSTRLPDAQLKMWPLRTTKEAMAEYWSLNILNWIQMASGMVNIQIFGGFFTLISSKTWIELSSATCWIENYVIPTCYNKQKSLSTVPWPVLQLYSPTAMWNAPPNDRDAAPGANVMAMGCQTSGQGLCRIRESQFGVQQELHRFTCDVCCGNPFFGPNFWWEQHMEQNKWFGHFECIGPQAPGASKHPAIKAARKPAPWELDNIKRFVFSTAGVGPFWTPPGRHFSTPPISKACQTSKAADIRDGRTSQTQATFTSCGHKGLMQLSNNWWISSSKGPCPDSEPHFSVKKLLSSPESFKS